MSRKYTKVAGLAEEIRRRKEDGETYHEIGASHGLTLKQVKDLMKRQRRKERLVAAGYIMRHKGRPHKGTFSEEDRLHNENVQLRLTVEVLRNFLSEVGRR